MSYIGNTVENQNYVPAIDYFNGDGSTVAFTLSRPVASVAAVQAVISNVPQNPGSAFTVSGSTITFTSAPPSGTANIYVYYTSPNTQVVQPGQGTVGPTQMSTGAPSWDTSGNVTFTGNLTLNNGTADGAQLTLNSLGYSAWNWDNYSGRLRAYYGATEYFTIDSSGNVGIGTSSPSGKLNVVNASTVEARLSSPSNVYADLYLNTWALDRARIRAEGANPGAGSGTGSGALSFWVAQNPTMTEAMRIDSSGNLLFNSGYGSVATAYGCRAWVNFNGTGTVAIRASGNVSSITDNGTGDYTINFTNSMPDVNYVMAWNLQNSFNADWYGDLFCGSVIQSTGSLRVISGNVNSTRIDFGLEAISVFR